MPRAFSYMSNNSHALPVQSINATSGSRSFVIKSGCASLVKQANYNFQTNGLIAKQNDFVAVVIAVVAVAV
jgi:hypothetical protein